ncbi:unnamed protein product [Closterium sp. NIES-54]
MADDVQKFVTSCDTCQRMKSSKQKKAGLLQPLPVPEQPWQVVSLDFITGLPPTKAGYDAILVVIDKFSKMGHFIPTHTTARTKETAQLFFRYVIVRDEKASHATGRATDRVAAEASWWVNAQDRHTERLNQIVEQLLRAACKDDISKWDVHLPVFEFAYNNATHAATGQTPFFLCYGRNPLTPQKPTVPATVQPAHDFITTMHHLWERTHKRTAPSGVSQVDPLPGPAPVQVAVDSGAARGAASGGAEPGGAGSEGAELGGAELGVLGLGGAASSGGSALSRGSAGASPRLSPQQLREWFVRRARLRGGATEAGGAGAAGAGVTGGTAATGPGGACTLGTRAAGSGGVAGARAGDPTELGAVGAGGTGAVGAGVGGTGAGGTGAAASSQPAPSPYTEQSGGRTERRAPASHPVSPVRTAHRAPRSRPPVPSTHAMALCPSSVPLRVPLPAPPESSLPEVPNPESDCARAASLAVSHLLATAVTDPSFESATASALVAEMLEFAAACRLDYATALVAESASAGPPSVGGECALGTDVLEDRQEDFECLAVAVPRFASMLLALKGDQDAPDIPTPAAVTLS